MSNGRHSRRRTWVAGGVLILLVAAVGGWLVVRPQSSAATPTTITATATTGTVRQTVSTTGTLAPARRADLSFAVTGTVTAVPVSVGSNVAKGATLAAIDDATLKAQVDVAQAGVDAAQDQVASAATGTSVQQTSAAAQLAAAQSTLSRANSALAEAKLTAPFAGTVAAVNVAVGDSVGGSSGGSTGGNGGTATTAAVTVISTTAWIIDASVGAPDLASIKKGLQVEITPDGSVTKVFGTVQSVGIMASSGTSGAATFPVTIAVTGSPKGLYAGGTVTAAIVVKQLQDVLTVPSAAVTSENGQTYVTVTANGKQTKTKVGIGAVMGGSTQITSGLTAGQQVVVRTIQLPAGVGGGTTRQRGQNGQGGRYPGGEFPGGGQAPAGGAGQAPVAPGAGQ